MSLRILPLAAGRQHIPATVELLRQTWPDHYLSGPGDALQTVTARAGHGRLPTGWLALWQDQVVGTVAIEATSFGAIADEGPWLVGLAVRRDMRGRGIGLQLIKTAARHTSPLWTTTQAAVGLMQRAGFAHLRHVHDESGAWQVMRRDGAMIAPA